MATNDDVIRNDIDLAATITVLRRGWRKIVVFIIVALAAAIAYLNIVSHRYAIEMRLAPVANSSNDGVSSKLSQLGGLAAVAGVSLPDSAGSGSFKLFVEALHSRDIADILARDPIIMHGAFAREWDGATQSWRQPAPIVETVTTVLKSMLGMSIRPFAPPGAARLQEWMSNEVAVDQNLKTPVVTVSLLDKDSAFAVHFLDRLASSIDAQLRQRALLRSNDYIRYLTARLPTVTLAEQRVAIAQALGEQERLKMAASSDRSYAAEVFEHPAASDRPMSPVPWKVLAIALMLGTILGIVATLIARPIKDAAAEP